MKFEDYLKLTRDEKLELLSEMFHHPDTSPEQMEKIHEEFKSVLNSTSCEPRSDTIYL